MIREFHPERLMRIKILASSLEQQVAFLKTQIMTKATGNATHKRIKQRNGLKVPYIAQFSTTGEDHHAY
jgi:hypothetical protein